MRSVVPTLTHTLLAQVEDLKYNYAAAKKKIKALQKKLAAPSARWSPEQWAEARSRRPSRSALAATARPAPRHRHRPPPPRPRTPCHTPRRTPRRQAVAEWRQNDPHHRGVVSEIQFEEVALRCLGLQASPPATEPPQLCSAAYGTRARDGGDAVLLPFEAPGS